MLLLNYQSKTSKLMTKVQPLSEQKKIIRQTRQSARLDWTTRHHLFVQAFKALMMGDEALGKKIMRDVINGNMGFESLAVATGIPSKSLHRMFSKTGNPTAKNLFCVIRKLSTHEGFDLQVWVKDARK